jgi:hypothetical protein
MALHGSLDQQKSGRYEVKAIPNPFYEYNDPEYPDGFIPKDSIPSFGQYESLTPGQIAARRRDQAEKERLQNTVKLFWNSVKRDMENKQ